jgi:hypothetical protein
LQKNTCCDISSFASAKVSSGSFFFDCMIVFCCWCCCYYFKIREHLFFFETAKILLNTFGYKIYTKKKERKKELKLSTHTGCWQTNKTRREIAARKQIPAKNKKKYNRPALTTTRKRCRLSSPLCWFHYFIA